MTNVLNRRGVPETGLNARKKQHYLLSLTIRTLMAGFGFPGDPDLWRKIF